jgi:Cu/Ag efflux protein CusF
MKQTILLTMVFLMLSLGSACSRGQQQIAATASPSPTPPNLTPIAVPKVVIGKEYPGRGVVLLINKKEGWIEIDHEEIKDLMPPMVMEWHVKKRSQLNTVKVGDKVEFIVVETGKGEIITDLKKAK